MVTRAQQDRFPYTDWVGLAVDWRSRSQARLLSFQAPRHQSMCRIDEFWFGLCMGFRFAGKARPASPASE